MATFIVIRSIAITIITTQIIIITIIIIGIIGIFGTTISQLITIIFRIIISITNIG